MATVLIVDDEFAITDLLEMVLVDEGYDVLKAANGRQGLERLIENPQTDLVISDMMMPILDGVGLLRSMRANEAHRQIPCIVMSSMPESVLRERIANYAGFVRKPFQLEEMVALVARVLSALPKATGFEIRE